MQKPLGGNMLGIAGQEKSRRVNLEDSKSGSGGNGGTWIGTRTQRPDKVSLIGTVWKPEFCFKSDKKPLCRHNLITWFTWISLVAVLTGWRGIQVETVKQVKRLLHLSTWEQWRIELGWNNESDILQEHISKCAPGTKSTQKLITDAKSGVLLHLLTRRPGSGTQKSVC